jgi:D-arginine dehydrogenase
MTYDFVVIGAGIAGASAGYALAEHGSVVVLEREDQPGYHSTGRSAAQYTALYGNRVIRALTRLGKPFFDNPPPGFAEHPILNPRGALFVVGTTQRAAMDDLAKFADAEGVPVHKLTKDETLAMVPVLRPDAFECGLHEPESTDIDVHGLHQGYLRGLRARGGAVVTGAEVTAITNNADRWIVQSRAGEYRAPVLVNAAGAWADIIAGLAGVQPVGLTPKRRTAMLFDPPSGLDCARWPMTSDMDEQWYFKPGAGRLFGSPADETPVAPCDVQPEELNLSIAIDRIEAATSLKIGAIAQRWAGLRSFVADKSLVIGFARDANGFFWLAGQGGYGIQTSPAASAAAAGLIVNGRLPDRFDAYDLSPADLSPARLFE